MGTDRNPTNTGSCYATRHGLAERPLTTKVRRSAPWIDERPLPPTIGRSMTFPSFPKADIDPPFVIKPLASFLAASVGPNGIDRNLP